MQILEFCHGHATLQELKLKGFFAATVLEAGYRAFSNPFFPHFLYLHMLMKLSCFLTLSLERKCTYSLLFYLNFYVLMSVQFQPYLGIRKVMEILNISLKFR